MFYEPNQVGNLLPYISSDVEWFIIGGPADGNEAQGVRAVRPDVKIIGFEPNPVMYNSQLALGFPGRLLTVGLWSCGGVLRLRSSTMPGQNLLQRHRSSSFVKEFQSEGQLAEISTLDILSTVYGPFTKIALWLDIEGAEIEALRGAHDLLSAGEVLVCNLEVFCNDATTINSIMHSYGLKLFRRWGHQSCGDREWWNAIYCKQTSVPS